MAARSSIEWTDATWNPVTGCTKISQGCKNCYAERLAMRLQAMGNPRYSNGFRVTLHRDLLELPLRWRQPRMIFVNSMSDLFHPEVDLEFIHQVFETIVRSPWHTYQILTKRPERAAEIASLLPWPKNLWLGTSVEDSTVTHRISALVKIPAHIHFLSCEPLLGPIPHLPLDDVEWVIVGGESGPGARPMQLEWVRDIQSQCRAAGVAFFFKQWGGPRRKAAGRLLDGQTWDELPTTGRAGVFA
mgnify:CR=1 FL=1